MMVKMIKMDFLHKSSVGLTNEPTELLWRKSILIIFTILKQQSSMNRSLLSYDEQNHALTRINRTFCEARRKTQKNVTERLKVKNNASSRFNIPFPLRRTKHKHLGPRCSVLLKSPSNTTSKTAHFVLQLRSKRHGFAAVCDSQYLTSGNIGDLQ